ncbi:MAG: Spy/CpxP family protein refolding chaperone [Acidobacteria bacterium]|nr:Spy/CpxP family protein refolding chaperone [Acidobacteriota bacterium]
MKSITLYLLLPVFAVIAHGQANPPAPDSPREVEAPNPPQQPRFGPPMQGGRMMPGQPMQGRMMRGPMRGNPLPPMQGPPQAPDYRALKDYLNLSDSQLRHMEQAREKARQEADEKEKALRPQIQQKRLALEDLLDAATPDAAAVGRALIEIRGLEKQVRQAREAVRTSELSVLTPEQKTRFKAIQDAAVLPEAARQARQLGLVEGPPQQGRPEAPRAPGAPAVPRVPPPPRQ